MSRRYFRPAAEGWAGWVRGPDSRAPCLLKVIKDGPMARDRASAPKSEEEGEVRRRPAGGHIIQGRSGHGTAGVVELWA